MEPKVLIGRIRAALQRLAVLSAGVTDAQLHADLTLQESLLWNLQVVSAEAAIIPSEFLLMHPQVDWSSLIKLRSDTAPEYYNIEWAALLRTMHESVPHLLMQVETILSNLD